MLRKLSAAHRYLEKARSQTESMPGGVGGLLSGGRLLQAARHPVRHQIARATQAAVGQPEKSKLDLTFNDAQEAYKSKYTSEVARAYLVLSLCGVKPLVKHNAKLMKLGQKILGKRLFGYLMKQTFYGHFVAGEDQEKIKPLINRMQSFGVKSILDYSVEEDVEEAEKKEEEQKPVTNTINGNSLKRVAEVWKGFGGAVLQASRAKQEEEVEHLPKYVKLDEKEHKEASRTHKLDSARVYFYQGEANCDRNMETFLRCIDAVKGSTGGTGFSAVKLTALGRPEILMRLSECIEKTRKYYTQITGKHGMVMKGHVGRSAFEDIFKAKNILEQNPDVTKFLENMVGDEEGIIHLFNWSSLIDDGKELGEVFQVPNLETGKMEPLMAGDNKGFLTKHEEMQFKSMINRLHNLFKYAKEQNVRVMIDAEQSYFQPAIHRLTMELMRTYNKDRAIVFNTYQCYLREAYKTLTLDLEQAKRQNFYFGAKLVRGAYMEQERARAQLLGYEDPINPTYEATTAMYHKCLDECLTRMHDLKKNGEDPQRVGIMVASHNEATTRYAVERMGALGLDPQGRVLCFAQLLGMCDQITFPLGQSGYSVYKYVPYGPVNEVLPYLSRRAHENGALLTKIEKEKRLLRQELARRIKSGHIFYRPVGNIRPVGMQ